MTRENEANCIHNMVCKFAGNEACVEGQCKFFKAKIIPKKGLNNFVDEEF